jgi:hypothetical protein
MPLGFKGLLQQIGSKIRNETGFVFGANQQGLMHDMAQDEGDAPRPIAPPPG